MPAASSPLPKIFLLLALAAAGLLSAARAQISADEQRKRELFLRAREAIVPAPAATPRSAPVKPQPRPRPSASPVREVERQPEPEREPEPPPKKTPRPAPKPELPEAKATPIPRPLPPERAEETVEKLPPPRDAQPGKEETFPLPREQSATTPTPAPTPAARVTPQEISAAPITIEKSGLEEEKGLEPPPQPERRGMFGLGGPRYRYLTRGVRAAIDRAPVKRSRWQYTVVHNSGTRQGNARVFDNYHRKVRHMQNGLAYHFVIGNGTSSGDGEIEIGSRWTRQINGGHVASDYLNNIAIGICLVGDYNRDRPTEAQLGALDELIRYLRARVGKTKGHVSIVKAHREINPKPTDCPGDRFPYRWLHRRFD